MVDLKTSAYPGQKVIVKFVGFDELDRPTTSSIRLSNVSVEAMIGHL